MVYSIYHMVLYSLPEGDGWVAGKVRGEKKKQLLLSRLGVHLYILVDGVTVTTVQCYCDGAQTM